MMDRRKFLLGLTSTALTPLLPIPFPSWEDESTLIYQWMLNGNPIAGANSPVYHPREEDIGSPIGLMISVRGGGGGGGS